MNTDDPERRQTLGARRADIVFRQHFQHGRPCLARDDSQRNGCQNNGRQSKMAERRHKGTLLARQQRIDQHEAGDWWEEEHQRDAT
ncbi:hypothetical protein D3C87_2008930 [compost metagenome]